jgi:predicted HicB family RNase H-like nuclease
MNGGSCDPARVEEAKGKSKARPHIAAVVILDEIHAVGGRGVHKETEGKLMENLKAYTVRLPEDMHRALKIKAAAEGVTMHSIIERLIREYLESGDQQSANS